VEMELESRGRSCCTQRKELNSSLVTSALDVSFTHVLLGFGVLNLMFGGIILCSKAKTDLIKLVRPEAPSEWPKFGLTEPMYTPLYPNTLPIAVVSIGSPVAVPVP